jgi:hypothetical protein
MELINETQAKNIKYTHLNFDIKEYISWYFLETNRNPFMKDSEGLNIRKNLKKIMKMNINLRLCDILIWRLEFQQTLYLASSLLSRLYSSFSS